MKIILLDPESFYEHPLWGAGDDKLWVNNVIQVGCIVTTEEGSVCVIIDQEYKPGTRPHQIRSEA